MNNNPINPEAFDDDLHLHKIFGVHIQVKNIYTKTVLFLDDLLYSFIDMCLYGFNSNNYWLIFLHVSRNAP